MGPPLNLQMSKDLKIEKKVIYHFLRKINYKETQNPQKNIKKSTKSQQKPSERLKKRH